MNILINLLPDTRQIKLKERRRRQLMTGIALVVWAVCGGALVLLGLYTASQKILISNNTKQIADKETRLKDTTGLIDALTAQQHLTSLTGLYSQRVYLTKFLQVYSESNPAEVSLTSMSVDASNALTVNGTATTYLAVAKLARALEAQNVTLGQNAGPDNQPYFSDVSIQSVSRSNNSVSFTLNTVVSTGVTTNGN
jgi:Tfp pilus assembly protein PilN